MNPTTFAPPFMNLTMNTMTKPISQMPSKIASTVVPKKRILVIDDEPAVRRVIQYCLEDLAGWETVCVGSAQDGLVLVVTQAFDAIVLDLMMPGMDGIMFLKALRSHPEASDILVILLTGKSTVHFGNDSDLEVAGIIQKPFDPIQLPVQVAQLLNWMPIASY
jgi:CheY-like chemotaxis protein